MFVLSGGLAACVNVFSRTVFSLWITYPAAIVLAYILGMITAFSLNKIIVFKEAKSRIHHQIVWFVVINLLAIAQTLGISIFLVQWVFPSVRWTFKPELCAHIAGVAIPVVTSYLGHKHLSFK